MLLMKDPVFAEAALNRKLMAMAEFSVGRGHLISQVGSTGCYWGEAPQIDLWVKALERIANPRGGDSGILIWRALRLYPALLLMYAGGLSSTAAERYSTFAALLTRPIVRGPNREYPLVRRVIPLGVLDDDLSRQLPGRERSYTPVSDQLFEVLREPLRELLPDDTQYAERFDRFEYLLALVYADILVEQGESLWGPIGRFGRRDDYRIARVIESEVTEMGESWKPLRDGLFGGSLGRFQSVKTGFDTILGRIPW